MLKFLTKQVLVILFIVGFLSSALDCTAYTSSSDRDKAVRSEKSHRDKFSIKRLSDRKREKGGQETGVSTERDSVVEATFPNLQAFVLAFTYFKPVIDLTNDDIFCEQNPAFFQESVNFSGLSKRYPDLKQLHLGDKWSPYDKMEQSSNKRLIFELYASFIQILSGEKVNYVDKDIETLLSEDFHEIPEEMFFDPNDTSAILLTELNFESAFGPTLSDSVIALRMKDIENEIPMVMRPEVRAYIDYFTHKQSRFFKECVRRSYTYFPVFERVFKENGVPEEIKYLSIIESGLKPQIRSHAGAVGLWQFIPSTGRLFHLQQNQQVDERQDPLKSTIAAGNYLKYLYKFFGDWELALASYNCGPGNVQKAIKRAGGGTKTFWEIYDYLPRETRMYVPQFIAVSYLMQHLEEHNIYYSEPYYPIETDTMYVNQYVDLRVLADELKICYEDLKELNPSLVKGTVPYNAKNFPVVYPASRSNFFALNEESILAKSKGKYAGKTYSQTTYASASSKSSSKSSTNVKSKAASGTYTVKSGDTISEIADMYGTTTKQIMTLNNLSDTKINIGQVLYVSSNAKTTSVSSKTSSTATKVVAKSTTTSSAPKVYTVKSGDTLWKICNKYPGLDVEKIKKINQLKTDKLQVGQVLKLG